MGRVVGRKINQKRGVQTAKCELLIQVCNFYETYGNEA